MLACLALGSYKKNILTLTNHLREKPLGTQETFDRLADVDKVNRVPLAEDVRRHLRVPAADAVAEMDTHLNKLTS